MNTAQSLRRRRLLGATLGLGFLATAGAARALQTTSLGAAAPPPAFTPEQSRIVRAWITRIIHAQIENQPTPRWQQRDCAGLVRFAVAEALRDHDEKWRRANGLDGQALPPDLVLSAPQRELRHRWRLADGSTSAYVGALELVQENSQFVSKNWNLAQAGDLFLFDQGDEQHLMVWMGRYVAYHTGTVSKGDNGLRAVPIQKLLQWRDTRWQPVQNNPNFLGVYRLAFLSR